MSHKIFCAVPKKRRMKKKKEESVNVRCWTRVVYGGEASYRGRSNSFTVLYTVIPSYTVPY
jgi:hypothetical protein